MKHAKKRRLLLESLYGRLYTRHLPEGHNNDTCFYCGAPRECLDHRPALATVDLLSPKTLRQVRIPLVILQSCQSCNLLLGARDVLTVEEALLFLEERLQKDYEKIAALWTKEEIEEMSPNVPKNLEGSAGRPTGATCQNSLRAKAGSQLRTSPRLDEA